MVVVVGQGVGAVGHTQHTWSCSLFVQANVIIDSCAKCFSGCVPYYTTLSMWQNSETIDIYPTITQITNKSIYMCVCERECHAM